MLKSAAILNLKCKKCTDSTIESQISTYLVWVIPALTGGIQTQVTTHTPIPAT